MNDATSLEGRSLRPAGVAGLAWAGLLLARGPQLFRVVQDRGPSQGERTAIVVLGARHAVQGAAQVLLPHRFAGLHAAVDGLHAASMLGLAALDPGRRRAALVSAALAALAGAWALRTRASSTAPTAIRTREETR